MGFDIAFSRESVVRGKWWLECGWVRAHCLGVGSPQGVEQNQTLYAPN